LLWLMQGVEVARGVDTLLIVVYVLVPMTIGVLASWWALPLTTAGFAFATVLYQLFLWRPRRGARAATA
jgi:hypothetical protein